MDKLQNLKAFRIVVDGNEASEYYASYCNPSWTKAGILPVNSRATIPDDLHSRSELKFTKHSSNTKYLKFGIKAPITPTEKAVWYSHFDLWKECCFLNEPILIMEHDSLLETPDNLWVDGAYGVIFYDKGAMGSYTMYPNFAYGLVMHTMSTRIGCGPYGFIAQYGRRNHLTKTIVNDVHPKYKPASNQVMSKRYGGTVEHFCTKNPQHWDASRFHSFIEID